MANAAPAAPTRPPPQWRRRASAALGALGLAVMVAAIGGRLAIAALPSLDMRLLVVLSGSMEPTIATGDAVVVRGAAEEDVGVACSLG